MSTRNDKVALQAIVDAITDGGDIARFVDTSARRNQHPAPSHTVLRRLAANKYVEVETHAVTPWTFGAGSLPYRLDTTYYRRTTPLSAKDQAIVDEHKRLEAIPGDPTFQNRKEIWVRITPRGREYLELLAGVS